MDAGNPTMFQIDASQLPRFMACNGSRLLAASNPPASKDATTREEGNAAHWLALAVYRKQHTIEEMIDRKAPNGVYITAEMAEYVAEYLDIINGRPALMEPELSMAMQGRDWMISCRPDFIGYGRDSATMFVDDFKYGWRIVEPHHNWTMIAYALNYCIQMQYSPATIVFTIHQPRPYHIDGPVRSWIISGDELRAHYVQLTAALDAPSDELRTNEHCAECHAFTTCPAARKAGLNAIDIIEQTAYDDNIGNDVLAYELETLERARELVKNRFEALQELAKHRISGGQVVENYSLERQLANRSWNCDIEIVEALTGKSLRKTVPMTPPEVERAGVSKDVVKTLTTRAQTGLKLTRVNAHKKAERIFGKGSE